MSEDINPFEHPPVYKSDQVATVDDLIAIRNGFVLKYVGLPWYDYWNKFKFRAGIGTVDSIIRWIENGKPEEE